jgi:hypothetical protein
MAGSLRAELIQAPDGWFYRPLERSSDETKTPSRPTEELLWDAVLQAGQQGVTYAALDRLDGLSRDIAKKRLPRWRTEKRVGRDGTGDKNDPYRWYPCHTG